MRDLSPHKIDNRGDGRYWPNDADHKGSISKDLGKSQTQGGMKSVTVPQSWSDFIEQLLTQAWHESGFGKELHRQVMLAVELHGPIDRVRAQSITKRIYGVLKGEAKRLQRAKAVVSGSSCRPLGCPDREQGGVGSSLPAESSNDAQTSKDQPPSKAAAEGGRSSRAGSGPQRSAGAATSSDTVA